MLVMITEVNSVTFNNVELQNDNSQEQLRALAKLVVISALWHGMGLLDRKNTALTGDRPVNKIEDNLVNQSVPIQEPVKLNISDIVPS